MSLGSGLRSLLAALQVPAKFSCHDIAEGDATISLEEWKITSTRTLAILKEQLERDSPNALTLPEEADLLSTLAAFDGNEQWISPDARILSRAMLASFAGPKFSLLEHVLARNVKLLFRSNQHPSLNFSTGRKLPRLAGGPMASQDYYEGQTWKLHPGAPNLVLWCVGHTQSTRFEDLWHLIIPPVMTLVDDYQAPYKLKGIEIISEMLERVPKDLLRRTGVDALLLSSLMASLHHLQNPETPGLIRSAIPAILSLIQLTTTPGSAERFNQLCALLGDAIIGGIWIYSPNDSDGILASIDVLPPVVSMLGIGSARYLKGLVPQLVHAIHPNDLKPVPVKLQLSSIVALGTVIDECGPRMHKWKGTILEGIGKCWVTVVDAPDSAYTVEVKRCLVVTCEKLAKACPSVTQNEYLKFLLVNDQMFHELVGGLCE